MDAPGFEDDELLLVDDDDAVLGTASKRDCHLLGGRTHRAIAVAVVDPGGRLLLARRAAAKPLWPGHWDATVASHPRPGESYEQAARRRLGEELGVEAEARQVGRFRYRIGFRQVGVEDELCAALVATLAGGAAPDPAEIDALEWTTPQELARRLDALDEGLCPWLPLTLLALDGSGEVADPSLMASARRWLDAQPFEGGWRLL